MEGKINNIPELNWIEKERRMLKNTTWKGYKFNLGISPIFCNYTLNKFLPFGASPTGMI